MSWHCHIYPYEEPWPKVLIAVFSNCSNCRDTHTLTLNWYKKIHPLLGNPGNKSCEKWCLLLVISKKSLLALQLPGFWIKARPAENCIQLYVVQVCPKVMGFPYSNKKPRGQWGVSLSSVQITWRGGGLMAWLLTLYEWEAMEGIMIGYLELVWWQM